VQQIHVSGAWAIIVRAKHCSFTQSMARSIHRSTWQQCIAASFAVRVTKIDVTSAARYSIINKYN